jgi:hypothetical protein
VNRIPNRRLWERVESDPGSMRRFDPLRWAVQAALVLYLLPVLLLVLLIGGFAMLAGGVARVLRKVVLALHGPALVGSGAVREREYGMKDRSA